MTNVNSVISFVVGKNNPNALKEVHETVGITQHAVGGDTSAWYQIIGGLILQGGNFVIHTDTSVVVPFTIPFPKVCYWLGLTIIGSGTSYASTCDWTLTAPDCSTFTASLGTEGGLTETVSVRWFAVGV